MKILRSRKDIWEMRKNRKYSTDGNSMRERERERERERAALPFPVYY